MSEHTPGPWHIFANCNVIAKDDRSIASAGGYSNNSIADRGFSENCANARLIAAAPDLLKALINARSILYVFGGDLTKYPKSEADAGRVDAIMWTAQDQIRAAIAKATGKGSYREGEGSGA